MSEQLRSPHPNALLNYQNAVIPQNKLEKYALNPTHPKGQHKAQAFKNALGFDQSNWELLKQCIINELPYHEAVPRKDDQHGKRYEVIIPITGPNGKNATVLTAWIIKRGKDHPSLTSAYVTE